MTDNNGNLIRGSLDKVGENIEAKTITGLTFKPFRELVKNTVYHVSFINGMLADGKTRLADFSSIFTTSGPKKIFTTDSRFHGNLEVSNSSIVYDDILSKTGIERADAFCNQDPNNPESSGYFKAILAVSGERYACKSGDNSYNGGCKYGNDWVLQPDTEYYNSHNVVLETTNSNSMFDFNLSSGIDTNGVDTWTGLASNWGNNANCYNWSSKSRGDGGKVGWSSSNNHDIISAHIHDCNASRALICVEQPQVALIYPYRSSSFGLECMDWNRRFLEHCIIYV